MGGRLHARDGRILLPLRLPAAKLGLRVGLLGRVGDDGFGRLVLQRLQESGVDTKHVIVDPSLKTGLGIALCKPDDRAILTYEESLSADGGSVV